MNRSLEINIVPDNGKVRALLKPGAIPCMF